MKRSGFKRAAAAVVSAVKAVFTPSHEATDMLIADAGERGLPLTYGVNLPARKPRKAIRRRSPKRQAKQDAWDAITARKIARGDGCERCGRKDDPTLPTDDPRRLCGHHHQLASQSGAWDETNHVLLCGICHKHIHDNVAESVSLGWIVVVKQQITPPHPMSGCRPFQTNSQT